MISKHERLEEIKRKRTKTIQDEALRKKTFKLSVTALEHEYNIKLPMKTKLLKDNGFNRSEFLRQVLLELSQEKIDLMIAHGIIKNKK